MSVFDKVKALRKQGKIPAIELRPGAYIPEEKRPRGRPRKYAEDVAIPARYVGRRGKARPRCAAKGCEKLLRVHQPVACSETCENRIINDALLRLRQCRITKSVLLELWGDDE